MILKNLKENYVVICNKLSLMFPLIKPSERWKLFIDKNLCNWHYVLKDITFNLSAGSILGVVGRNGAGKSTLLRTLAGIYEPNSGSVIRLGEINSIFELGGMGGLFITGNQYVKRWLRLNGVPQAHWKSIIDDIREFSELGDRLNDRIFTYSSGMVSRLYFSTATCISHKIYLIDEILSVGDEHFQSKCWQRMRERLSHGVTGVLVTHDWTAILRLCENAFELKEGQIANINSSEIVVSSYLQSVNHEEFEAEAQFSEPLIDSIHVCSQDDLTISIPIEIFGNKDIIFDYTIEKLIPGKEWQIIFFGGKEFVGNSPGNYVANISIKQLPLPMGDYRFNLFLTSPRPSDGGARVVYDVRSWITANCINLRVEGDEEIGLVVMPVNVEIN